MKFPNKTVAAKYILLIAQLSLIVVSGYTTYTGFNLVLNNQFCSFMATFGIQTLLMVMPYRLHFGRINISSIINILISLSVFIFSALISIIFSYHALIDRLVPSQLRDDININLILKQVDAVGNTACEIISNANIYAEKIYKEKKLMADQEDRLGGSTDSSSISGKGKIYKSLLRDSEKAKEMSTTMANFLESANNSKTSIADLITSLPQDKAGNLQKIQLELDSLVTLAKNPLITDFLKEQLPDKYIKDLKFTNFTNITTIKENSDESKSERFLYGLELAKSSVDRLILKKDLDDISAGVMVAIFIAILFDILTLILGWAFSLDTQHDTVRNISERFLDSFTERINQFKVMHIDKNKRWGLGLEIKTTEIDNTQMVDFENALALKVAEEHRLLKSEISSSKINLTLRNSVFYENLLSVIQERRKNAKKETGGTA